MQRFILAIDQGTTGTTALVFDEHLHVQSSHTVEFKQHFPQPAWVEHDLDDIWNSVIQSVTITLNKGNIDPKSVVAIGITNQRETTCLWQRNREATPLNRAIVWQDRRTHDECERLKKQGLENWVNRRTGLRLDPYFSGTKLQWMLKNIPGSMKLARAGKLAFGTIESYLLYRMSGNHYTDPSNACRTLLMNIRSVQWDDEMLKLLNIPEPLLPEILPSSVEYGKTFHFAGIPDGTPITGLAGDQQAALFGQACFTKGSVKCTYGTGAFILANTGTSPIFSKHRLLTSVAWKMGEQTTYCLEGSAFIAGAAVQWLRDGLQMIKTSAGIEQLAATVHDSDGVVFVPALSGMGAPHWLATATGLITGLTRRTTNAHLARATLEGIAFQVNELLESMKKDVGKKLSPIKVDGGASADALLMQFQANLLNVEVVRSKIMETTALGAGLQAGLAIGFWSDMGDIQKKWEASESFKPAMTAVARKKELVRWENAIEAVKLLSGVKRKIRTQKPTKSR
jgi:glycerol kinase